jgi:hypothetical protein
VGSIPIARFINPVDSTILTRLGAWKSTEKQQILDGSWTEAFSIGRNVSYGPPGWIGALRRVTESTCGYRLRRIKT